MSIRAGVLASFRIFQEAVTQEDAKVTKRAALVHQASVMRMSMRSTHTGDADGSPKAETTRSELDAIGEQAEVLGDSDDDGNGGSAMPKMELTVATQPTEEDRRVFSVYQSDDNSGDEVGAGPRGESNRSGARTGKVRALV